MSDEKKPYCRIAWDFEPHGKSPKLYLAEDCGQTLDEALADRRRMPDVDSRTETIIASKWILLHPDDLPSQIVLEKVNHKTGPEFFTHLRVLHEDGTISSTLGHYMLGTYERAVADYKERVRREIGSLSGETELEM